MIEAVVVAVAAIGVGDAASIVALEEAGAAGGLGLLLRVARAVALVLVQYHAEWAPTVPRDLRQAALVRHTEAEVRAVSVAGVARVTACKKMFDNNGFFFFCIALVFIQNEFTALGRVIRFVE